MDELAPPPRPEEFLSAAAPLMGGQTPQNVLLRAMWVLRDPSRWTCFHAAVDAQGRRVHPSDPAATRWSLEGAVAMACNPHGVLPPFFMRLLDDTSLELFQEDSVNCLEEYGGHPAIMCVLARAIEKVG